VVSDTHSAQPALPPQAILLDMLCGMMKTLAIHEAARLRIADLVEDGPKSTTELAEATGTNEEALYRLLSTLASLDVFAEIKPGYFAQTPLSSLLRPEIPGSMYDIALIHGEEWQWHPWEKLSYSIQTGQTAFDHMYGEDLWSYFARNSLQSERFQKAMGGFSAQVDRPIAQGYDFSAIHTLVDVGGGYGSLLTTILKANPGMHGILFDLPPIIEKARASIEASAVADRCKLVAGSVLEGVPTGADAYIMKQIIKDWDDEHSICILANCRKAMKPGGKVLVAEQVLLPGKHMSTSKLLDLQLMVVLSGRERYEAQFRQLFEVAGLRLARIWPTHSPYSILEGVAQ
jgi:O-methyltransferase domain